MVTVVLLYYDYQRARAELVRDSITTARALMLAVSREFTGVETSLRALSTSPFLDRHDLSAFHDQAKEVLVDHYIDNITLVDAGGQQRMNTARPYGQPLPKATNVAQLQRILTWGRSDISEMYLAPAPDRQAISVAVPVRTGTTVTHSLMGVVLPEHLQKILVDRRFPPDRIAVIADGSGTVVARTHEIGQFIGQIVTPLLAQRLKESDEGSFETVTLEGIPVLIAFVRSATSGWSAVIGTPIDGLTADLRRSLWLLIGLATLLLAGSLGLAWIMGGRIARAIHALRHPALALGYGKTVAVPELPIREVNEVGKAITKASAMLADANAALTASEARMRGILESAMDAIITVDEDQRIVLYNRAAERIFGWPSRQVLGEQLEKLMPERFRASHAGHIRRFSAMGTTSRRMGDGTVLYGLRASGEEFPMEAAISQLDTAEGKLFSVILRDVTARVRVHEALERSNLDLQQFAFVASHDLKTPLRSIAGFVQILERNYGDKLDEKALALIQRTSHAVHRLEQLTEDLLTYARMRSEAKPFVMVDCREVVDEVIHLLDAAIRDTGAVVTVGELPSVMGDRTQLVQLLLNLLGNSMKYCRDRAPAVHILAQRNGREWVFSVKDNGIGIDAKHYNKIFEVFIRLHNQQEYSGTGIGLAVCRRVVAHHGGRIWVESAPGEGSTFSFTIPDSSSESSLP